MKYKYIFYVIFAVLMSRILYLLSFPAIHGEVNFFNDVGRDFLLLQELDRKKIVLIGPRTNVGGLFHGPLWTYMSYPAYLLGHGNPVISEWFWIFLAGIFLFTSFFIAKKFFGTFPALAYILLVSTRLILHISGTFHSEVTFLFVPIFFFSIAQYLKTKKISYLSLHLIISTVLIQLNIGIGIPLLTLSVPLVSFFIFKNKLWKHFLSFLLIPLCLSNFIIFDLRHNFQMTKVFLNTIGHSPLLVPLSFWIQDRITNTISLQLIENGNQIFLFIIFVLFVIFTIIQIKNKNKQKDLYLLLLFYYFGYMLLTFTNKGVLLVHLVYLLIPLTYLWLVSFLSTRYRFIFLPIVCIVFILNLNYAIGYVEHFKNSFIGKSPDSWIGLSAVADEIISWQKGEYFGYFVYAPDAYAYQPRYAMIYNFKTAKAKASEYLKESTTYVISAPPPRDNPYMAHEWWIKNSAKISNKPVRTKKLSNGFTIEEFNLSPKEQKIPFDQTINLGIHFR